MGWTFTNGQAIYQLWNATYSQTGAAVKASNMTYNAAIAPNGSAEFGFLASWTGTNGTPTSFTVNGAACS